MDFFDMLVSILGSTVRLTIPLLFTALAGLFSERAGVFDIGLEGKMLAAAFASACVAYLTANPWAGLLAGIAVSILFSLIHGFAVITNRGNQIVSGVALNFIAAGLTVVLGRRGSGRAGARRNCRAKAVSHRSSCLVRMRCAKCLSSARSTPMSFPATIS